MANAKTVTLTLKTVADIQDVVQNVKQIQGALNQLKMPETMATTFKRIFDNIEKNANKAGEVVNNNFRSKSDVSKFEQAMGQINSSFLQLRKNIAQIPDNVISDSFTQDLKEVAELQKRVNELTDQYKARLGQIDVKALNDAKNAVAGISKSKSWDSFIQNLTSGNIEGAQKDLEQLAKTQQRFNDEAKRNEFGKSLDIYRAALNGLTADNGFVELRRRLEEAGLAVQNVTDTQLQALLDVFHAMPAQVGKAGEEIKQYGVNADEAGKETNALATSLDRFKSKAAYFLGLENAVRLFRRAVRSAYETVKDLDAVMTETAVVTDFSVGDMWSQLPEYTDRANALGVSIHSAYEAATLYYQQGLSTNEVIAVSNETLKMARIASLDAATATDRMTNALRGFNMTIDETNAKNINDVYSKLAAITASNVDEISTAMTKVASLANNANMSFENTSAFLAQIIETTRESAETAGTALKTVIARFSEVKELYRKNQLLGIDTEGKVVDVNKVSAALRTAGINLNEYLTGMKGLDQIFLELASKWNGLDQVQQRYIATMAAGSRQQSRFIALMSDYNRTQELVAAANNASGAAQEQFNKTLDSLESKLNKLKNAWDSFLMSIANNEVIKFVVDALTWLIEGVNKLTDGLPGLTSGLAKLGLVFTGMWLSRSYIDKGLARIGSLLSGKIPEMGVKAGTDFLTGLKSMGGQITQWFRSIFALDGSEFTIHAGTESIGRVNRKTIEAIAKTDGLAAAQKEADKYGATIEQANAQTIQFNKAMAVTSVAALGVGLALRGVGSHLREIGESNAANVIDAIGNGLMGLAAAIPIIQVVKTALISAGVKANAAWGWIGLALSIVAGLIVGIVSWVNSLETTEEKLERITQEAQKAAQAAESAKQAYDNLLNTKKDYNTLITQLEQLTAGTRQWYEQINKVNESAKKLIDQYKILKDYIDIDEFGIIRFKSGAFEAAEQQESKRANILNSFNIFKEQQTALLKVQKKAEDLRNEAVSEANEHLDYLLTDYQQLANFTDLYSLSRTKIIQGIYEKTESQIKELSSPFKNTNFSFDLSQLLKDSSIASSDLNQVTTFLSSPALANVISRTTSLPIDLSTRWEEQSKKLNLQTKEGLQSLFESLTKLDYDELIKDQDVTDKKADLTDRLRSLLLDEIVTEAGETITNNTSFIKELKKGLDADVSAVSIQIAKLEDSVTKNLLAGAFKNWKENLELARQDISSTFTNIFGAALNDTIFSYSQADSLLKMFNLSVNGTNIGASIQTAVKDAFTSQDLTDNELSQLVNTLSSINFNSAIDGAHDLNQAIKATEGGIQRTLIAIGLMNNAAYNMTAQANELYKSFTDEELEKLFKDGKITTDELRKMAVEGSRLKKVIDNTGVSINTLADYFNKIKKGILDAHSATDDFVKILNQLNTVDNVLSDTFNFIKNFDAGRSDKTVEDFISNIKKNFTQLYNIGAYSDEAMASYEHLIFNDEMYQKLIKEHNGNLQNVAKATKQVIDSIKADTTYGLWARAINKSQGSGNVLENALSFDKNKSVVFDFTQIDSAQQILDSLVHDIGYSEQLSQIMLTNAMNLSDTVKESFDRLSENQAFKEWLKAGKSFGESIFLDPKELKVFAEQFNITTDSLQKKIKDVFENNKVTISFDTLISQNGQLNDAVKQELQTQFSQAVNKGYQEGTEEYLVDLLPYYDFLIKMGMDPTQAATTIEELWKNTNIDFSNISFKVDPITLKLTAQKIQQVGNVAESQMQDSLSEGIKKGVGDYSVDLAIQEQAYKMAKVYAKAIAEGIWVATEDYKGVGWWSLQSLRGSLQKNVVDNEQLFNETIEKIQKDRKTYETRTQLEVKTLGDSITELQGATDNADSIFDKFIQTLGNNVTTGTAFGSTLAKLKENGDKAAESLKNISLKLGDPLTELNNLTREIAKNLREQTVLERRRVDLLRSSETSGQDMRQQYADEMINLQRSAELQNIRKADIQALLRELPERMNLQGGTLQSFSDWGVGRYVSYDAEKQMMYEDIFGINSITSENLKAAVEAYSTQMKALVDELYTVDEQLYSIEDSIYDLQIATIESYRNFEERVMDAYINMKEKEIQRISDTIDTLNSVANTIISKIQEQISMQRQLRENERTEQEINKQENRLAYLRRDTSGANNLEILQLEKSITEAREGYGDNLIDQALDQMRKDADIAAEQRAMQLTVVKQIHEEMIETGGYWSTVEALMLGAVDENGQFNANSELAQLLESTDGFKGMSEFQKDNWRSTLAQEFNAALPILTETQLKTALDGDVNTVTTSISDAASRTRSAMNNAVSTVNTNLDTINTTISREEEAFRTAMKTLYDTKLQKELGKMDDLGDKIDTAADTIVGGTKRNTPPNKVPEPSEPVSTPTLNSENKNATLKERAAAFEAALAKINNINDLNKVTNIPSEFQYLVDRRRRQLLPQEVAFEAALAKINNINDLNKVTNIPSEFQYLVDQRRRQLELSTNGLRTEKFKLLQNAKGGMINFTGPAWLDGTRSNPEAVLSPIDTRNFILLRDVLGSLLNNINNSTSDGVTGDAYYDIDINAEIGSDYDVDQLANRIKRQITESASYRNVNTMNFIR